MRPKGANGVGRFSVEIEVANYGDLALAERGLLPSDEVRRETIQGVVDSGATRLVLPGGVDIGGEGPFIKAPLFPAVAASRRVVAGKHWVPPWEGIRGRRASELGQPAATL